MVYFGFDDLIQSNLHPKLGIYQKGKETETMAKLLIVEDNVPVAMSVQEWLEFEGHTSDIAVTGNEALEWLHGFEYDAMILDWDLPEVSGIEVLRQYRDKGGMSPVLMLTGKSAVEEKAMALDAGADDYLTKPFHPKELGARMRALLRRPTQILGKTLSVRNIALDTNTLKVTRDGQEVVLQRLECALLAFFLNHPQEVFSTDALLRRVWDSDSDVSIDAIYQCIKKIRKKLDTAGQPSILRTVHGIGYRLEA